MGLFSYGKRHYRNYSLLFGVKLDEIIRQSNIVGVTLVPDGETLKSVIGNRIPQKSEFKGLDAIDRRISDIISKLELDTSSRARFSHRIHAVILFSLFAEKRAKGAPAPEDFEISFEDRFAECGNTVERLIDDRDKLACRIKETEEKIASGQNDLVMCTMLDKLKSEHGMVLAQMAPYIGQFNSFVEQLETCSHTFGKLSARAESIQLADLLASAEPETERIKKKL